MFYLKGIEKHFKVDFDQLHFVVESVRKSEEYDIMDSK